ncbi:RHS repeat-associated core domain-containing protein, partial [Cronobacter sakazakii]
DAEVYWYHNDVSGMPRELTGAGGEIAWRAEYRAWGNTLRVEHIETRAGEPVYQPLRYQGQYFDAETGLHYNRFRYYDPDAGRFISQDPIGLAGGINLYQYAPNPLVWVDPLGLKFKCDELKNKDLGKDGVEIERIETKKGTTKVDIVFNNMNDAKNWASGKLGLGKTRMYDANGKWVGWQNKAGDSVYWGHGDWGQGVGKSTFPHLNININGEKGHLFLKDKIINRGQWDDFAKFFQ